MTAFEPMHLRVFEIPDFLNPEAGATTEEIAKHLEVSGLAASALLRGMEYAGWVNSETTESKIKYWFATPDGLEAADYFESGGLVA